MLFLLVILMLFVFLGHMETLKAVFGYVVSRLLHNSHKKKQKQKTGGTIR